MPVIIPKTMEILDGETLIHLSQKTDKNLPVCLYAAVFNGAKELIYSPDKFRKYSRYDSRKMAILRMRLCNICAYAIQIEEYNDSLIVYIGKKIWKKLSYIVQMINSHG